jgi:hypothetical protein
MPQVKNIISEKYFNQFTNSVDFLSNTSNITFNLVGNVEEQIKAEITLTIEWFAKATADIDEFNLLSDRIIRNAGDFKADGFNIGDVFDFRLDYNTASESTDFTGTVTSISADGRTLFFSTVGTPTQSVYGNAAIRAKATDSANYLTALIHKFALIENNEELNFTSKVTDSTQIYQAVNVGEDIAGRQTNEVTAVAQGSNKGWITGNLTIQYDDTNSNDYAQAFIIRHTFIINPYYLDGQIDNITNSSIPDLLEGNNSLKYAYEIEARRVITNPNTGIIVTQENNLGSVGYFGENFNGIESDYTIESVSFQDTSSTMPKESLQITNRTTITILVSKNSGSISAGQRVGLIHSILPPESEYSNTTTEFQSNFLYDIAYHNQGDSAGIGQNAIIKSLSSSIVGFDLQIVAEIEYTTSQQQRLTAESFYSLSVVIADSTLTAATSDRVNIIASVDNYDESLDIEGLLTFTELFFYTHEKVIGVDSPTTNLKGWNEDDLSITYEFYLDLAKSAYLNSLELAVIAYNTSTQDYFILDSYNFDLSSSIRSSGVQQININNTRGYILEEGSNFNKATLQTGNKIGDLQYYSGVIGQKIPWETWIQNLDADSVFYDDTKSNNNLNFRTSNYSDLNSYEIRFAAISNLSGVNDLGQAGTTNYLALSPKLFIYDYDKDGELTPRWTGTLQTFDEGGVNDLGGKILTGANTLIKMTWTDSQGAVTDLTGFWGFHTLEIENETGKQVYVLSTIQTPPNNNLLIPVVGETQLKLSLDSGNVISECLIDYTKLGSITNYRATGRLESAEASANAIEFLDGQDWNFLDGQPFEFLA